MASNRDHEDSDWLRRTDNARSTLQERVPTLNGVLDASFTWMHPNNIQGIVDVDGEASAGQLHEIEEWFETHNIHVNKRVQPTSPVKKLGGPFLGTEATDVYEDEIIRYEVVYTTD